MAENRHDRHDDEVRVPDFERPGPGHEEQDVNPKAVTQFGVALVLLCICALLGLWVLFNYFLNREKNAVSPAPPMAGVNVDARKLPPEPRLQSAPILDLKQMRAAEDQILGGYAWLDPDRGVVRIPIDRAIDLLAQRGLPARPQGPPQPPGAAVSVPTESALGPKVQQVGGPLAGTVIVPPVQPEIIRGTGDLRSGRQAGGPPTPPDQSPASTYPATRAGEQGAGGGTPAPPQAKPEERQPRGIEPPPPDQGKKK